MRSCIWVLYVAVHRQVHRVQQVRRVAITPLDARTAAQVPADDPEALYKDRENLASARKAADIWAARLASQSQGLRVRGQAGEGPLLAGHQRPARSRTQGRARRRHRRGAHARSRINANRPEGHFWLAANMGALAESFGMRQGIKYRGPIKDAL